ncbi:MAG: NAD-dependent epimerase/dehydratase family protein, partial [Pirellulaceae bacterium]
MCDLPPVLVTGATGFIGPHLVRRLVAERRDVTVLVRPGS